MKESKGPTKPPKPNMKNKDFVKWSKSESCKREDSIVSTEWHETLKKTEPFAPAYGNKPLNMVYLLSGEYGRLWLKERDEWYANVFVPKAKEKDMMERRAKIKKQAKEAKKAAQKSIKERKERKAKEAEVKAKAEAEKAEKIKAKLQKCAAAKKASKASQKKETKEEKEVKEAKEEKEAKEASASESNEKQRPQEQIPEAIIMHCECSGHDKENPSTERKEEQCPGLKQEETSNVGCILCPDFLQKLGDTQDGNVLEELRDEQSKDAVAAE